MNPRQRQRYLFPDSLTTKTSLNAPDDEALFTLLPPLIVISKREAPKAMDQTFPQITLDLAVEDLIARNIGQTIQDLIGKGHTFPYPATPA